jgi:hypothetical protein
MPENNGHGAIALDATEAWMHELGAALSNAEGAAGVGSGAAASEGRGRCEGKTFEESCVPKLQTNKRQKLTGEVSCVVSDSVVTATDRTFVRVTGSSQVFLYRDSSADLDGADVFAFADDQTTVVSKGARVIAAGRATVSADGGWIGAKGESVVQVKDGTVDVLEQAIVTVIGRCRVKAWGGTVLVASADAQIEVRSSQARIVFLNSEAELAKVTGCVAPGQFHTTNSVALLEALNELEFRKLISRVPSVRTLEAESDAPVKRRAFKGLELTMDQREAVLSDCAKDMKVHSESAGWEFQRAQTGIAAVNAYLHLVVLSRYNRFARELLLVALAKDPEEGGLERHADSSQYQSWSAINLGKIGTALLIAFDYDLLVLPPEIKAAQARVRQSIGTIPGRSAPAQVVATVIAASASELDRTDAGNIGSSATQLTGITHLSESAESQVLRELESIIRGCVASRQSVSGLKNSAQAEPNRPDGNRGSDSGKRAYGVDNVADAQWRESFRQVLSEMSGAFLKGGTARKGALS